MKTCGRMLLSFRDYGWSAMFVVRRGPKRQTVAIRTRRRDYVTPMARGRARRALQAWMRRGE